MSMYIYVLCMGDVLSCNVASFLVSTAIICACWEKDFAKKTALSIYQLHVATYYRSLHCVCCPLMMLYSPMMYYLPIPFFGRKLCEKVFTVGLALIAIVL